MRRNLRSMREIRLMRQAGRLVWEAHQAAAPLVQAGVTTAEIDQAVAEVFQRADAEPLFLGFPGKVPFPAVTCISVNDEVVHGIPGDRQLHEGDVVSIDTGCRIQGWCGDAAITHPVGQIEPDVQHLLDVTRSVLDLAIELMGSMQRWSQVARQMQTFVEDAGCSVVEEFVGHAIGREMHESPQVPNYFDPTRFGPDADFELRPGVVLAIEPMVNLGSKNVKCLDDHWTQVTVDGKPSAHFEHTVALTPDGPVRLTGPPEVDELLGI